MRKRVRTDPVAAEAAMRKTRWSVLTALGLTVAAVALMMSRRSVLGPETDGPPGWKVTLLVQGELKDKNAALTTELPPDFRNQHISDERFQSDELRYGIKKRRNLGQRR